MYRKVAVEKETADAITRIAVGIGGARSHAILGLDTSLLVKSSLGKLSRKKIQTAYENGDYEHAKRPFTHLQPDVQGGMLTVMEATVQSVFTEALELDVTTVGLDTNIYDAGVTSIELLRLKTILQTKTELSNIPLTIVSNNACIRGIAAELEKMKQNEFTSFTGTYTPVVILGSKGTKTPLWLVHPGVGEVLVFLNLAKHIIDRPVYALRARGFEEKEDCFESISQIIDNYRQHIKETQPHGPYAIAGYSFGAVLAFEVTKQLEAGSDGADVKSCGSLNLPPHIKQRTQELDWIGVALNLRCSLGFYGEGLQRAISPHKKRS
ncbi:hypothetical protein MMC21_006936 [Puttea exsequens]|nr:hypothetical protein [Puttea exsequens]